MVTLKEYLNEWKEKNIKIFMIKKITNILNELKPYIEIYYKYKKGVNLLALISIYIIAIYVLYINPLDNIVDIYLENIAATIALNNEYIYIIENILKLKNNNYNVLIVTFIISIILIINIKFKKNFILPLAASVYSFMYNFYNNWNAGTVILFQLIDAVRVEKTLSLEEKFKIWKESIKDIDIKIHFENIEPLIRHCNDPISINNFLNILLDQIRENSATVEKVVSNNWFYEHSTALLISGVLILSLTIIIIVASSSVNNASDANVSIQRILVNFKEQLQNLNANDKLTRKNIIDLMEILDMEVPEDIKKGINSVTETVVLRLIHKE